MNTHTQPQHPTLSMRITNPQVIVGGTYPHFNFDYQGGTIGSQGANWLLHDYAGKIAPLHAQILMVDDHYCLTDYSGNTFINGASKGIGKNRIVRLSDGDSIRISNYIIHVNISHEPMEDYQHGDALHGLDMGEIIDPLAVTDDSQILIKETDYRDYLEVGYQSDKSEMLDPLSAIDGQSESLKEVYEPDDDLIPANEVVVMQHSAETPIDYTSTTREAIVLPPIKHTTGDVDMKPEEPDIINADEEPNAREWYTHLSNGDEAPKDNTVLPNHIAARPLMEGMGVSLGELDSERANAFLHEVGHTIRAMIEGIMKIYQEGDDVGEAVSLSLLSRNLQPIEDNPLRLKQDYKHTVQTMFSDERSYVHLSPPRAIEESLEQIANHHQAMLEAIQASLKELLSAFSPTVLERRFARYTSKPKSGAQKGQDWAWQMYTHYYNELISSRQQGFEKLFWEVFEQTYDNAMRKRSDDLSLSPNQ